jgi:hypothetical protein
MYPYISLAFLRSPLHAQIVFYTALKCIKQVFKLIKSTNTQQDALLKDYETLRYVWITAVILATDFNIPLGSPICTKPVTYVNSSAGKIFKRNYTRRILIRVSEAIRRRTKTTISSDKKEQRCFSQNNAYRQDGQGYTSGMGRDLSFHHNIHDGRSRDSSVGIAKGYELDGRGSNPGRGKSFSFPQRPGRLWGPPRLLSKGNRSSKAAVQGLVFMAHPLYIHTYPKEPGVISQTQSLPKLHSVEW